MIENIIERTMPGTNTVYLNIPEEDFFLSYETVTMDAAKEIAQTYFLYRTRDGFFDVKNIDFYEPHHRVTITLEVRENEGEPRPGFAFPSHLNTVRNNEDD
jgi:hypothetical protein